MGSTLDGPSRFCPHTLFSLCSSVAPSSGRLCRLAPDAFFPHTFTPSFTQPCALESPSKNSLSLHLLPQRPPELHTPLSKRPPQPRRLGSSAFPTPATVADRPPHPRPVLRGLPGTSWWGEAERAAAAAAAAACGRK